MQTIALPDGERIPALGQGTWRMGENKRKHTEEVAATVGGTATMRFAEYGRPPLPPVR